MRQILCFLVSALIASDLHAQLSNVPDWLAHIFTQSSIARLDSVAQDHVYGIIGPNSTMNRMWYGMDEPRLPHEPATRQFTYVADRKNRFIGTYRATTTYQATDFNLHTRYGLWSDSTRGMVTQESDTLKGQFRKIVYFADIMANVAIISVDDEEGRVAMIFDLRDLLNRTMTCNTNMTDVYRYTLKPGGTGHHLSYATQEYLDPHDKGVHLWLAQLQDAPCDDTWNWLPMALDPGKFFAGMHSPLPGAMFMHWKMEDRREAISYQIDRFERGQKSCPTLDLSGYIIHDKRASASQR